MLLADKDVRHGSLTGLLQEIRLNSRALLAHLIELVDLGRALLVWDRLDELLCSFAVWLRRRKISMQCYAVHRRPLTQKLLLNITM